MKKKYPIPVSSPIPATIPRFVGVNIPVTPVRMLEPELLEVDFVDVLELVVDTIVFKLDETELVLDSLVVDELESVETLELESELVVELSDVLTTGPTGTSFVALQFVVAPPPDPSQVQA